MATPPESTKISVGQRLRAHAATHWPQAGKLEFRYRGAFVYVEAHLPDGTVQPLIRLRYGGSARHWGFGLYLASSDRYENQILPNGFPSGSPEEALDCACSLYLDNPVQPITTRRTSETDHLVVGQGPDGALPIRGADATHG